MGLSKNIKMAMLDKEITSSELAGRLGIQRNSVSVALSRDTFTVQIAENYANKIDCDIVLRDRKTGKIY